MGGASSARQLVGGSFRSALPAGTRVCPESRTEAHQERLDTNAVAFGTWWMQSTQRADASQKQDPATRHKGLRGVDV